MRLSCHGLREILGLTLILGVAAAALVWTGWWLAAAVLGLVWLAALAFFRDPQRAVPAEAGLLVSPADGRVTEISQLNHHDLMGGPATRIGIFLSVFDVHVNRSPCAGRVVKTDYCKGLFLDARHPESGARNEANTVVIEPEGGIAGPVVVRQVAGLIARRIVCSARAGDRVERGGRIGLIKFGSRTELIVPKNEEWAVAVRVGDRAVGGETVLMRFGGATHLDTGRDSRDERVRDRNLAPAASCEKTTCNYP